MYYPFIRGKQFELLMLREMAPRIARWGFVPIIEPVKGNFSALKRALEALIDTSCRFILISNPTVGELKNNNETLWAEIIKDLLHNYRNYSIGLNLTANDTLDLPRSYFEKHSIDTSLIHYGYSDGRGLSTLIESGSPHLTEHVFVEQYCTKLYRRHFQTFKRVLVRDGFQSQTKNSDYPPSENFSDLYLTFRDEEGCDAFGDFLIVGNGYRETGGPAFAVAIHLTYKDPSADDIISIKHYISDRIDTKEDPAGKFLEALEKLVRDVNSPTSNILKTDAVKEYLRYYNGRHFPGLGYVKKLSMQHHLELMGNLLGGGD